MRLKLIDLCDRQNRQQNDAQRQTAITLTLKEIFELINGTHFRFPVTDG